MGTRMSFFSAFPYGSVPGKYKAHRFFLFSGKRKVNRSAGATGLIVVGIALGAKNRLRQVRTKLRPGVFMNGKPCTESGFCFVDGAKRITHPCSGGNNSSMELVSDFFASELITAGFP